MNVPFVVILAVAIFLETKLKGQQWPGIILGAMLVASLDPGSPILQLVQNMNQAAESAVSSVIQGAGELF